MKIAHESLYNLVLHLRWTTPALDPGYATVCQLTRSQDLTLYN